MYVKSHALLEAINTTKWCHTTKATPASAPLHEDSLPRVRGPGSASAFQLLARRGGGLGDKVTPPSSGIVLTRLRSPGLGQGFAPARNHRNQEMRASVEWGRREGWAEHAQLLLLEPSPCSAFPLHRSSFRADIAKIHQAFKDREPCGRGRENGEAEGCLLYR